MIEVHVAEAGQIESLLHALAQDHFGQFRGALHGDTAARYAKPVFDRTSAGVRGHHTKRWIAMRIKGVEVFIGDNHNGVNAVRGERVATPTNTSTNCRP